MTKISVVDAHQLQKSVVFLLTQFLDRETTNTYSETHTLWEKEVAEKTQLCFHCLRQKKQDLEVHIRCLLSQYLLVYFLYGFTDWLISQELENKGDGLGLVCSWLSYASVCTGYSLSLVVLRLFTITLSRKDSQTG